MRKFLVACWIAVLCIGSSSVANAQTSTPDPSAWSVFYDFRLSDYGFSADRGTWVAGTGWVQTCATYGDVSVSGVQIHLAVNSGSVLLGESMVYSLTQATGYAYDYSDVGEQYDVTHILNDTSPGVEGTNVTDTWSGSITGFTQIGTHVDAAANFHSEGCPPAGVAIIQSFSAHGTGVSFPTVVPSATTVPSATAYGAALFPTAAGKPYCVASATPGGYVTRTPGPTWTPLIKTATLSGTVTPSATPFFHVTETATLPFITATAAYDCIPLPTGGGVPIVNADLFGCIETTATPAGVEATFVPDQTVRCKEDCYTVLPSVNVVFGVINPLITAVPTESAFVLQKTTICASYRVLNIAVAGIDMGPFIDIALIIIFISFILWYLVDRAS